MASASDDYNVAGQASWTNYAVSAWVNLADLAGTASILGRFSDPQNHYELQLGGGGANWQLLVQNNSARVLAGGTLAYSPGTWIKLKMMLNGSTITALQSGDGTHFRPIGSALVDGDADADGNVDSTDFASLIVGFGSAHPARAQGDFNGSGGVDSADFNLFVAHYGQNAPPVVVTDTTFSSGKIAVRSSLRNGAFDDVLVDAL